MKFGQEPTGQENRVETIEQYGPVILPVKDTGDVFIYDDREYIPEEIGVVEKIHVGGDVNRYVLVTNIGELDYLFRLSGRKNENSAGLSFKTLAYEYAVTNLSAEDTQSLFERLADFLETAYQDSEKRILSVDISPADQSYTKEEIEDCISEIMKHKGEIKEEDLRENYKGYKIFDMYEEIFKKDYHKVHYNSNSRAYSRSRYFKIQFKKVFKNWRVDDTQSHDCFFALERKS